jgi:signal transduction histidine kinase
MSKRELLLDLTPAVALTAVGIVITLQPDSGDSTGISTLLVPAITVPVFWWRRAPLPAALAIAVGMIVSGIPTFDQTRCGFAIPGALLILFSLASRSERPPAIIGLAAVEAGFAFLLFTDPALDSGAAFILVLAAGVWGAGRAYRSQTGLATELAERTGDLERTREETAQLAVEIERTKVAAELDVAASERIRALVELARDGETAVVQAPSGSREAFAVIERDGRESLNQIRELLGVLRSDEHGTAPRPTLAELEKLIEQARAGNRTVQLSVEGRRRPLPTGVELAAYRVIQHALEALEIGEHSPANVSLRYLESELQLEVSGTTPHDRRSESAMAAARERAAASGGRFTATREGDRRLLLQAWLPIAAAGG